jgi:hypothetical protein
MVNFVRSINKYLSVVFLAAVAAWGSGCKTAGDGPLTYRLWDNGSRSYCEPVANPDLALSEVPSKRDILVEYNAISDQHDGVRRLAYLLEANRGRIAAGKAPHFINPKRYEDLKAIPNFVSANCYALVGTNGQTFTLYQQGREPESFILPDYRDDHNTLVRAALTPFAVVGDAAVVSTCAAIVAWYMCANNGDAITLR